MCNTAHSLRERLVWRYEVDADAIDAFEHAYGPGGDWDQFFTGAPGYQGTEFYRCITSPNVYITVDYWSSSGERDVFVASRQSQFDVIDARCERFTKSELRLA